MSKEFNKLFQFSIQNIQSYKLCFLLNVINHNIKNKNKAHLNAFLQKLINSIMYWVQEQHFIFLNGQLRQ